MAEKEGDKDKQENISKSGLSPLKSAMYRTLWSAALFSYIGAAMFDVGASWLMTSLSPNPLFVSLITTATAYQFFCLRYHQGYYLIFSIVIVYFLLHAPIWL